MWFGFAGSGGVAATDSIGGCAWESCTARAVGIKADKPLPNTLRLSGCLLTRQNLLCKLDITFSTARAHIVRQDRFAETGGLGETDASRDDGSEDLILKELAEILCDLAREVGAVVKHGE